MLNTLTLEEKDGRTILTLHGCPINATKQERKSFDKGRSSMQQGFFGTWDKLQAHLAAGK